jgi:hypothetical protein
MKNEEKDWLPRAMIKRSAAQRWAGILPAHDGAAGAALKLAAFLKQPARSHAPGRQDADPAL